jgi:hypothetical protein
MSFYQRAYANTVKETRRANDAIVFNHALYALALGHDAEATAYVQSVLAQQPPHNVLSIGLYDFSLFVHLFPENGTAVELHRAMQSALNKG